MEPGPGNRPTNRKAMEKAIVYRQGNNWIANINGYLRTLGYWVKTKKQVREALEDYEVEFA